MCCRRLALGFSIHVHEFTACEHDLGPRRPRFLSTRGGVFFLSGKSRVVSLDETDSIADFFDGGGARKRTQIRALYPFLVAGFGFQERLGESPRLCSDERVVEQVKRLGCYDGRGTLPVRDVRFDKIECLEEVENVIADHWQVDAAAEAVITGARVRLIVGDVFEVAVAQKRVAW